mgnify:CR=1 FL=1
MAGEFTNQLEKVVDMLRERCNYVESGLFQTLLEKYEAALNIVENQPVSRITAEHLNIEDGSRIFLKEADSYNDKLLIEIKKTERMYEKFF